jgi:ParB family chromosome partitioning protein
MLKSRSRDTAPAILRLSVAEIYPNPYQPRQSFDQEGLCQLADSIRRYGVLSPLSVRYRKGRYELVAGERRLRAAKLAGLSEVPCLLLDVDSADSGAIALVENLQRQDLDYLEEAQGIARLIAQFGWNQEECAQRLGKSQSSIANKLRLLKLPPDILDTLRTSGLSERHGRALLRLTEDDQRRQALRYIIAHRLTVAATDSYIDRLLSAPPAPPAPPSGQTRFVLKDVRVFFNSLQHSIALMRRGGVTVDMEQQETDETFVVTIRIQR